MPYSSAETILSSPGCKHFDGLANAMWMRYYSVLLIIQLVELASQREGSQIKAIYAHCLAIR